MLTIVKKALFIVIILLVLIGLSLGLSFYAHSKFFGYSFLVGLAVTFIIWFFTSKGGVISRNVEMTVHGITRIKTEHQKFEFYLNPAFITSRVYTVFTFAAMFYQYRDYL